MQEELLEFVIRSIVFAGSSFALLGLFGLLVRFLSPEETGAAVM